MACLIMWGPIVDTVEIEIYFKEHKERILMVILDMSWLACHNPEIDWKMGEVKIMRYLDKCGKKWRVGKQTKPE